MSYKKYSQTSSGWTLETDPEAPADKRWRITHPMWGERFFENHDDILPWTCKHMVDRLMDGPWGRRLREDWAKGRKK